MSDTFFIGDLHFGHANILKFEPVARPFSTLEEMHEVLVDRWNSVVKKHDKVFVLGDFAFGVENIAIADRLMGQKRLILGNHDCYPIGAYLKYFLSVHGVIFWQDCILTHVPVHPHQLCARSKYNIHGHLHSKIVRTIDLPDFTRADKRYINVSCEMNNLTPINADEIQWQEGEHFYDS